MTDSHSARLLDLWKKNRFTHRQL